MCNSFNINLHSFFSGRKSRLESHFRVCVYRFEFGLCKCCRIIISEAMSRDCKLSLKCKKSKAVPLQAWSGPEGSRKLRFPDYMKTARDGGKVVSLTDRPSLPP